MKAKILLLILIFLLLFSGCLTESFSYKRFEVTFFNLFDTYVTVTGYAQSREEFDLYADIIFTRLTELHRYFDIYNTYDGLNNVKTINDMAGISPVAVSDEIIELLKLCRLIHDESNGAVDITLGPVLSIWHEHRIAAINTPDDATLPDMQFLLDAFQFVNMDELIINDTNKTVFLAEEGMSIDVGAVAKGFAVGLALTDAKSAGALSILIDAGGNVAALGKPLDGRREHWNVAIQNPNAKSGINEILGTIRISDAAAVTSGDYHRYYFVNDVRYGHLINPGTLMPAKFYRSVTVIHEDSGTADALSAALFILPYETGFILAERFGAAALWVFTDETILTNEQFDTLTL